MSKQLKYKLKKTLKNAEFVHADLEYHKELLPDAENLFNAEIKKVITNLSEESQKKLDHALEERLQQRHDELIEQANKRNMEEPSEGHSEPEEVAEIEDEAKESPVNKEAKTKSSQLKKIFHKIATQTHPDKLQALGLPTAEIVRREELFIKARKAYDDSNWYILYSIATSLDIPVEGLSDEHINWVEDDIRNTLAEISIIGNLLVWIWYTGDEERKRMAVMDYIYQTYGLDPSQL
tara:strand:- start:1552 stop:2259 length:708 start_codon:yes stop_codon:yes gene_type:complete